MNDLSLGQVVQDTNTKERGVVLVVDGEGAPHPGPLATRYVISVSPTEVVCTDNENDQWMPVGRAAWTYTERIVSADIQWKQMPHDQDAEGEESTYSYWILSHLVWPLPATGTTDVGQLVKTVGQELDDRLYLEKLRGIAQERLNLHRTTTRRGASHQDQGCRWSAIQRPTWCRDTTNNCHRRDLGSP